MLNKTIIAILISVISLIAFPSQAKSTLPVSTKTVILSIPGMTCPVCPITIKKALEGIAGVNNVTINFGTKMVAVVFNPHQVRVSDLIEATNTAGYSSAVESKP